MKIEVSKANNTHVTPTREKVSRSVPHIMPNIRIISRCGHFAVSVCASLFMGIFLEIQRKYVISTFQNVEKLGIVLKNCLCPNVIIVGDDKGDWKNKEEPE